MDVPYLHYSFSSTLSVFLQFPPGLNDGHHEWTRKRLDGDDLGRRETDASVRGLFQRVQVPPVSEKLCAPLMERTVKDGEPLPKQEVCQVLPWGTSAG